MRSEHGIYLRHSTENDIAELKKAFKRSELLHSYFIDQPNNYKKFTNQEHRYLVCLKATDEITGFFNISEIVKGCFHSAYLGYAAFEPFQKKGLMSEGFREILKIAFEKNNLHRLEANIQPDNLASKRLVEKVGFIKEGYSKNYLKVNNEWRDHERWAIINQEWVDK